MRRLARISCNSSDWRSPTGEAHTYETAGTYDHKQDFGHEDCSMLTADGEKKLAAALIGPGEQFPRALLDSLYRGYPSRALLLWATDVGGANVLPADVAGRPGKREGVFNLVESLSK